MLLTALNAISPIDGRYRSKTKSLSAYFSEEALIKYRVQVEIEYFIALCELPLPQLTDFNPSLFEELRSIYKHFSNEDALQVKEIENTTNHDVKAVEYFIKNEFDPDFFSLAKKFLPEDGIYFDLGANYGLCSFVCRGQPLLLCYGG